MSCSFTSRTRQLFPGRRVSSSSLLPHLAPYQPKAGSEPEDKKAIGYGCPAEDRSFLVDGKEVGGQINDGCFRSSAVENALDGLIVSSATRKGCLTGGAEPSLWPIARKVQAHIHVVSTKSQLSSIRQTV